MQGTHVEKVRGRIRIIQMAEVFLFTIMITLSLAGFCENAFAREEESGYAMSPWRSTSDFDVGDKSYRSDPASAYTLSGLNNQGKKFYQTLLKKGKKSTKKVKIKLNKKVKLKVSRASYKSGGCWYSNKIKAIDKICARAAWAVTADQPDLYWIDSYDWSYLYYYKKSKSTVSIKIVTIVFKPVPYYVRAKKEMKQVKSVVKAVSASIMQNRSDASRYTTARLIYEYLASTASYGFATGSEHSPAGILLDKYGHVGVCDGYAQAFKMICDACGIPCKLVSSEYYRHAWNMVQLENGVWYGVDVTWGDDGALSDISYRWFMYGQNEVTSGAHPGREIHSYTDKSGETFIEFQLPALAETTLAYAA